MNNFQKWANMKYFQRSERIACILYILGVANRQQLVTVTGWSDLYVKEALQELRDNAKMPQQLKSLKEQLSEIKDELNLNPENKELEMKLRRVNRQFKNQMAALEKKRDEWLIVIKGAPKEPNFYTLGKKGIEMVKEIQGESNSKFKNRENPKRQVNHFNGINEILMRIRKEGIVEDNWLSGREVLQTLGYYWNRKNHLLKKDETWTKDKPYIPCKPDALITLEAEEYFLEYDANTESFIRLKQRMNGYLELYYYFTKYQMMKKALPKYVVWVCDDEKRKEEIEKAGMEAREEFLEMKAIISEEDKEAWKSKFPYMMAFTEGEDTDFLVGKTREVESFI